MVWWVQKYMKNVVILTNIKKLKKKNEYYPFEYPIINIFYTLYTNIKKLC